MIKGHAYLAVIFVLIGSTGCRSTPRMSLEVINSEEGNVSFKVQTRGLNSHIYNMVMYDNPNCEFIWSLRSFSELTVKSFEISYGGKAPEGMFQQYPKRDGKPRDIKAGEIIIVTVDVAYDYTDPTTAIIRHAYRVNEEGEWILYKDYQIKFPEVSEPVHLGHSVLEYLNYKEEIKSSKNGHQD